MPAQQQLVALPGRRKHWVHPDSLAALMKTRVAWNDQPKCAKCGSPAIKGKPHCPKHDGRSGVAKPSPARLDARWLERCEAIGLLPMDLIQTPLWQDLNRLGMTQRASIQRALTMLWGRKEQEPLAFAQVWRTAHQVVRTHGGAR